MKKYNANDLFKSTLIFLPFGLIITFLNLINVYRIYITVFSVCYIVLSYYLVFFTKIGDLEIFKNKHFERYYENHTISGNLLILGIIFFSIYIKNNKQFSLMGILFMLIGLVVPYISRKSWND